MSNEIGFRANSKLERLIGRELITNNIIAFFELIKNSYDAGANKVEIEFLNITDYKKNTDKKTEYYINSERVNQDTVVTNEDSKIIIRDNGNGMSFEEVNKFWMEIGVVHKEIVKELNVKSSSLNKMYRRVMNGEKGIGRFGTDKLGAKLILTAIDKEQTEKTIVLFDWDKYNDHSKLIQEVQHEYRVEKVDEETSGVCLEISNLRDNWTIKEIEDLKKQLKKFVSPFSQEVDQFSITINVNSIKEKVINDAFEFSKTFIDCEINEDGIFKYDITDKSHQEHNEITYGVPNFGPLNLKIIYMDKTAKAAFTKRTGISSREYGNIKVFRDNFRIFPYGEPENDWLGIDNKHAQAVFRSLGTRDIIGYVQISNLNNKGLNDATNRVGLVEDTKEFQSFKEFIWKCINLLQNYIFNRIKERAQKQGNIIDVKVKEGIGKANDFKNELIEVIKKEHLSQKSEKNIINLVQKNTEILKKDYDEVKKANLELSNQVKVFQRISGTEGMLYDLLHTLKNKTAILDAQLMGIRRQAKRNNIQVNDEAINRTLDSINNLITSALRKASSQRLMKKTYILSDIIKEAIDENINYSVNRLVNIQYNFKDNGQKVYCNKESIKIVFDNLFNNSFKALENTKNKLINIETYVNNEVIDILYSDNGKGIKDEDAPFIFNVSFTNTGGNGLGLSNCLDILKNHKGDISYVDIKEENYNTTFKITLPLSGGN
ncbi:sensor histidine kinase [Peribacillus simplex]|uniref:sensor histidine kinase n=1 Tax=Peribacillus simplex TaxID=1478 RepID=UPI002E201B79|nr:sensor histidine kinase [Peribacillus simplex]